MLYPEAFKVNMPVIARSKISWGYRGLDKQNFVTSWRTCAARVRRDIGFLSHFGMVTASRQMRELEEKALHGLNGVSFFHLLQMTQLYSGVSSTSMTCSWSLDHLVTSSLRFSLRRVTNSRWTMGGLFPTESTSMVMIVCSLHHKIILRYQATVHASMHGHLS